MTSASDSAGGVVRTLADLRASVDPIALGAQLHALIAELYPICRSITGEGLRRTSRYCSAWSTSQIREVPSGTQVFDWTVPKEWNIRDAYVKNLRGERVIDFHESNLHVVSYSVPVHARLGLAELRSHLFTLPEQPDVIPYRTAYYAPQWGFCLSHRQLTALEDQTYEVCIDSALEDGSLTFGECYLPGATDEEVLISCHSCHPSLCNDNLSGMSVATLLASHLRNTLTEIFVSVPLYSRDDRLHHLAGTERSADRAHPPRPCHLERGGSGAVHLQKESAGLRIDRSCGATGAGAFRPPVAVQRLFALWVR